MHRRIEALINMLENDKEDKDVFQQIQTLKDSIKGVEGLLVREYVREHLTDLPKSTRDKFEYLFKIKGKI